MLRREGTALVLVDVQGRLADAMCDRPALMAGLEKWLRGFAALRLPVIWCEQVPEKLGPTVPELAALLPGQQPIAKNAFSCAGELKFLAALAATGRRQVILCGIETHVCVYQTAMDLLAAGYEVSVATDAVSSRTRENRNLGLEAMRTAGIGWTGAEMALFELLRVAEGDDFRAVSRLVR